MDLSNVESGGRLFTDGAYRAHPRTTHVGHELVSQSPEDGTCSQPLSHEKDNIQRRLKSFVNWTGNALPTQLAIAGFMFTGQGDIVQCEICKVKLCNWEKDMVPLEAHGKHSPNCGFLKIWFPLKSNAKTSTRQNGFNFTRAKYQDKVEFTKRLATFDGWPLKDEIQPPQNMSLAGFFYFGSADRARCFNCGLTLRDWDTDDDPFAVHLQWAPKCEYIIHIHKDRKSMECFPKKIDSYHSPVSFSQSQSPGQLQAATPANTTEVDGGNNLSATSSTVEASSTNSKWKYSTQFEAVMSMGFQPALIQKAIDDKIHKTGNGFPDVTSLYQAVEQLDSGT